MKTRNYNTRYIRSLYNSKDELITDPSQILGEQESFYKTLNTKPQSLKATLDRFSIAIPTLNKESVDICNALIKHTQIYLTTTSLGTDGFTQEFYQFFWIHIKNIVFDSLTDAFESNSLSMERERGILTTIPQKGKDLRRLKNWRPLSVLNTDYKILTNSRTQKVHTIVII